MRILSTTQAFASAKLKQSLSTPKQESLIEDLMLGGELLNKRSLRTGLRYINKGTYA